MDRENVCAFHKFGYCRNGDNCIKIHVTERCMKEDCGDVRNCSRRHPRPCKYFQEKGFCKFNSSCKYDHRQPKNVVDLNGRIDALEKQNELLKSLIIEQNVTINSLIVENSKSIESLEKKIDLVINVNNDKNEETKMLLKDVKEIKDFVLNLDFGDAENDQTEGCSKMSKVEEEAQGWDEETVKEKAKVFVAAGLKHLDKMETEIQKVRKNSKDIRLKFRLYCDKMEEEINECGLVPSVHSYHATCETHVFLMKRFLNQPVTKEDKDDALKIIEEYRSNFNNLIKEMTDSTTTK